MRNLTCCQNPPPPCGGLGTRHAGGSLGHCQLSHSPRVQVPCGLHSVGLWDMGPMKGTVPLPFFLPVEGARAAVAPPPTSPIYLPSWEASTERWAQPHLGIRCDPCPLGNWSPSRAVTGSSQQLPTPVCSLDWPVGELSKWACGGGPGPHPCSPWTTDLQLLWDGLGLLTAQGRRLLDRRKWGLGGGPSALPAVRGW